MITGGKLPDQPDVRIDLGQLHTVKMLIALFVEGKRTVRNLSTTTLRTYLTHKGTPASAIRVALEWLSPLTFVAKHDEVTAQRHPGTGDWLLEESTFHAWLHGEGKALLFNGMRKNWASLFGDIDANRTILLAGAGKTTLTYIITFIFLFQLLRPL